MPTQELFKHLEHSENEDTSNAIQLAMKYYSLDNINYSRETVKEILESVHSAELNDVIRCIDREPSYTEKVSVFSKRVLLIYLKDKYHSYLRDNVYMTENEIDIELNVLSITIHSIETDNIINICCMSCEEIYNYIRAKYSNISIDKLVKIQYNSIDDSCGVYIYDDLHDRIIQITECKIQGITPKQFIVSNSLIAKFMTLVPAYMQYTLEVYADSFNIITGYNNENIMENISMFSYDLGDYIKYGKLEMGDLIKYTVHYSFYDYNNSISVGKDYIYHLGTVRDDTLLVEALIRNGEIYTSIVYLNKSLTTYTKRESHFNISRPGNMVIGLNVDSHYIDLINTSIKQNTINNGYVRLRVRDSKVDYKISK